MVRPNPEIKIFVHSRHAETVSYQPPTIDYNTTEPAVDLP
jgi:hypothetical protein